MSFRGMRVEPINTERAINEASNRDPYAVPLLAQTLCSTHNHSSAVTDLKKGAYPQNPGLIKLSSEFRE